MKEQGIHRSSAWLPRSFGDWAVEENFAWTSQNDNRFNKHICKSRRSDQASNNAVARTKLAVAHRESHK